MTIEELTSRTVGELLDDPRFGVELCRRAVVATALGYYDKNPYIQYEATSGKDEVPQKDRSAFVTKRSNNTFGYRRTRSEAPEYAMPDTEHFAQCSEFCYDVYMNSFGFRIPGGDSFWFPYYLVPDESKPDEYVYLGKLDCPEQVALVYDPHGIGLFGDREYHERGPALDAFRRVVRPGDVVVTPGHIMLYVGRCMADGKEYMMHCWPVGGGNLRMDSGRQAHENGGAAILQTMESLLLGDIRVPTRPRYVLTEDKTAPCFGIIRPLSAEKMRTMHMSPATAARLLYPRMAIFKALTDRTVYDQVQEGELVTVYETVRNNSSAAYAHLPVCEPIGEGTEFVSCSEGGVFGQNAVSWELNVPATKEVRVSYTVKITKKCGETVTFPAGTIASVPTRTFKQKVGKAPLTAQQRKTLAELKAAPASEHFEDLDYVNRFYREVLGMEIGLPKTVQDYVNLRFEIRNLARYEEPESVFPMMVAKELTGEEKRFADMEVPMHLSGRYVCLDVDDVQNDARLRAFEIREYFYQPGDVFVTFGPSCSEEKPTQENIELDIYLGCGKALRCTAAGTEILPFADSIALHLRQSLCVTLRPAMV